MLRMRGGEVKGAGGARGGTTGSGTGGGRVSAAESKRWGEHASAWEAKRSLVRSAIVSVTAQR